jgi:hypothetical protein
MRTFPPKFYDGAGSVRGKFDASGISNRAPPPSNREKSLKKYIHFQCLTT